MRWTNALQDIQRHYFHFYSSIDSVTVTWCLVMTSSIVYLSGCDLLFSKAISLHRSFHAPFQHGHLIGAPLLLLLHISSASLWMRSHRNMPRPYISSASAFDFHLFRHNNFGICFWQRTGMRLLRLNHLLLSAVFFFSFSHSSVCGNALRTSSWTWQADIIEQLQHMYLPALYHMYIDRVHPPKMPWINTSNLLKFRID